MLSMLAAPEIATTGTPDATAQWLSLAVSQATLLLCKLLLNRVDSSGAKCVSLQFCAVAAAAPSPAFAAGTLRSV